MSSEGQGYVKGGKPLCNLDEKDAELLFSQGYKDEHDFGIVTVDVANVFGDDRTVMTCDLFSRLHEIARANNEEKNLPLTLLNITDYSGDEKTVNHERIYLVFRYGASEKFRTAIRRSILGAIRFYLSNKVINSTWDTIDFWGGGTQLPIDRASPVLKSAVALFKDCSAAVGADGSVNEPDVYTELDDSYLTLKARYEGGEEKDCGRWARAASGGA